MSYKVKLQSFEGPFDLLVYLIENAEMSIYDIRISEITNQYLEYIRAMEENDINVATEFMVLASTLIEIKSKMILPRMSIEGQVMEEEDPRTGLVESTRDSRKRRKSCKTDRNIPNASSKSPRRIFRGTLKIRTSISALT